MFYPTIAVVIGVAVSVVVYDIWVVWRHGAAATVSWTLLTWWTVHPFLMAAVFILIGHLFFPQCAPTEGAMQEVGRGLGTALGIIACALMTYVMGAHWCDDKIQILSPGYFARLAILAACSVLVGHEFFAQYVACG